MKAYPIEAAFSGSSYPFEPNELLKQFGSQIQKHTNGNGRTTGEFPPFLLVPHIDLRVNLQLYAETYSLLLRAKKFPDCFYILGVGHRCPHEFSAVRCDYQTPLGMVKSDVEPLEEISRECGFPIERSPATFKREHSLEYVVVWLQAVRDLYFPGQEFRIVPVLLGGLIDTVNTGHLPPDDHEISRFGGALAASFRRRDTDSTALIASIDGCHVGPRFGHSFAALKPVQNAVKKWEAALWRTCRSDRLEGFINQLSDLQNCFYFDGVGVLSLLLRNFHLKAVRSSHDLWYETADHSFVTFSAGYFKDLK